MTFADLKPCCACPQLGTQEITLPSPCRLVAPNWNVRIVCHRCGMVSPYCETFDKAAHGWNLIINNQTKGQNQ